MYLSRLGHDPIANNTPVALGDEARFAIVFFFYCGAVAGSEQMYIEI